MYQGYFGLDGPPFSIVPDHRVVYMSDSHREAVAHLLHSLETSGGFVQLTGEVGTGKTTVSRYLLQHLPDNVDVALLLNPRINEQEMLETICDELGIEYPEKASLKQLIGALNDYLLHSHAAGRHTVLIIDEAQNLSREVLEQVRLLTNLETSTDKLLQIILIGQPELVNVLGRHDLRQLAQRIIGRFTLEPLNLRETREYIGYRLKQAGCERSLFTEPAVRRIHRRTGGVPRLINVLCDSALMGAYSESRDKASLRIVERAAREVLPPDQTSRSWGRWLRLAVVPVIALVAIALTTLGIQNRGAAGWLKGIGDRFTESEVDAGETDVGSPDSVADQAQPASEVVTTAKVSSSDVSPADTATGSSSQSTEETQSDPTVTRESRSARPAQGTESGDTDSRFDLIYRLGVPYRDN